MTILQSNLIRSMYLSSVAMVLALTAQHAEAAIVSGPIVQDITSNTDTSLVLNTGIYVNGKNVGNANLDATINSVLFKRSVSGFFFEGGTQTPGNIRYVGGTAATSGIYNGANTGTPFASTFSGLLDSTDFNGAREAIVGLDPNVLYRVQLLVGDNRGTINTNPMSYAINSGTFTAGSPGSYISNNDDLAVFSVANVGGVSGTSERTAFIATFFIDGVSALDIEVTSGQAFISGISVFEAPPAPEPSGFALFGLGTAMLAIRRRKA